MEHTHEYLHEHGIAHTHGEGHGHVHENTKAVLNRLARAIGHLESVIFWTRIFVFCSIRKNITNIIY